MPNEIPIGDLIVAGTKYRKIPQVKLAQLKRGDPIQFIREPKNEFDPNAIICMAYIDIPTHIGYVPAKVAKHLAPMLDNQLKLGARVVKCDAARNEVTILLTWTKENSDATPPKP